MSALVIIYEQPGDSEEARRLCDQTLADPAADTMARQWALIVSALASLALGDWQECRRAGLAGADIGRQAGELWGRELSLRFVAHAEWQLRRHKEAEAALVECLHIDRQLGDLWHMAWSTETLGWVAADTGRFERGARLLGIAAGLWAQTGSRLGLADPWQAWHAEAMEHLRERLGAVRLTAAIEAGRRLTRAEALAFALQEAAPVAAEPGPGPVPLSARELEVAALVAAGLGNRAIAERLFLSAADMLFATLDPTVRLIRLPHGGSAILSDTVGFISSLPTTLISAFRATLEEVLAADVIVHLRDISHPDNDAQSQDVDAILAEIGVADRADRVIEVWNKLDCLDADARSTLAADEETDVAAPLAISAVTGGGRRSATEGDRGPAGSRTIAGRIDARRQRRSWTSLAL